MPRFERVFTSCRVALVLLMSMTSVVMFRTTVLSIVLLFAVGPSTSVFCKAWCDPDAAAASGCHHQGTGSTTVVSNNMSCQEPALTATALQSATRRGSSSERAGAAVPIAFFQTATATSYVRPGSSPGLGWFDQQRPLSTPLRI
jgi:hypothetical protein